MGEEVVQETTEEVVIEEGQAGILENDPLGNLFSDETSVEETGKEKEEAIPATETEETGKEEKVMPTETEEGKVVKPAKDENEGFKAAYFAEKEKRQKLESKVKTDEKPKPFDWTNPDNTIKAVKDELRVENENRFIKQSLFQLGRRESDAKEKLDVFDAMAKDNPTLFDQMIAHPDPAQYAYDLASQKMFTDEVGADPKAYKEKMEAEIRAKLEKEFNGNVDSKVKLAKKLPPSANSLSDNVPIEKNVNDNPLGTLFPGQTPS